MNSLNKVMLIGNLTRDPEVRQTQDGTKIVHLAIATSERWRDRNTGEQREKTEWHRASMFGPRAEILAEYAKKGHSLYIEGRLQTRKWQDRDGNDRFTTEVNVSDFQFLERRGSDGGDSRPSQPRQRNEDSQPPSQPTQQQMDDLDDDIPF